MAAIIAASDLVKRFDGVTAVDHISFEVPEGVVFGFLGPNGAGKTTTIKMLTTVLTPSEGRLRIAGHDPVKEPLLVRRAFGIVFQDPMPKARRTNSGSFTGSWPAILSRPSLGVSTVVSILIVVVLPAPLGPRNPKMMPSGTANEMWSTAVTPSKRLTRSRASMMAATISTE